LAAGDRLTYTLQPDRYGWLQVGKGLVTWGNQALREGDGVAIAAGEQLDLSTDTGAELLLFDLA
ncbi:MAG TPA: hypothetical protein V6D04_00630, partial [Candidatus Obscuribacterales bacterium]